jgi:capsular polysaccharide biosynthesis protein
MNIYQFLNLIIKKKQTFVSLLVIFLAIAIIFSAVQPFKYNSSSKLLTIINFKESIDPYTASRSNEYLSNLLARIVLSESFFEKIKESGLNIDKNYFSGNEKKQMKKWSQTVKAKSIADTGMISVNVYHTDKAQAENIAKAVASTLQTTNSQYHGYGNNVGIKIIDQPITSNYPVLPNVPLDLGLAVAFSCIFFLCYIYLFPEEKYNIRLWPVWFKKNANLIGETSQYGIGEPAFAEAVNIDDEKEIEEDARGYQEEKEMIQNNYNEENFQDNGSMENILKK